MSETLKHEMQKLGMEKRDNYRIAKKLSAKYKDRSCTVLNVSNKGVLLQTELPVYHFPIDETIIFELEIDEHWMSLAGTVQWTASYPEHNRVGLSISNAPEIYVDYLKYLYE